MATSPTTGRGDPFPRPVMVRPPVSSAQAEVLLRETEEQVQGTVNQFGTLFSAFETISGHLTNELRKMDVTVSQLPISFNHLRDSLQALLERAKKR